MEIRQLTGADAAIFQELRLYGLQESPTAFGSSYEEEQKRPLEMVSERLEEENSHVFGAFSKGGELVGVTGLYRETRVRTRHKAFIWGVYVAPQHRGRGIGHALMEAAISRARGLGLRQVYLSANSSSRAAINLYETYGFERFGIEKEAYMFEGEYYDSVYMAMKL
jgi:ribosomal protein S18 acetylase RimI-like enzyme